jgi:ribosomal protein S18 acetylase RimI-like enzyme
MGAMFEVRLPLPTECGIVSELILQSDCGLLPELFGDTAAALLSHLQAKRSNPYAAENALVVVDESVVPTVVGALIGSLAAATRSERLRTAALLFRWYGPAALARFPRLARAGKALDDLKAEDFYLSHIAVLSEHRGQGAGRTLLLAGEDRASLRGGRRMVLDVEESNEGACAFYARLGYRPISVLRIDLGPRAAFSFLRFAKDL